MLQLPHASNLYKTRSVRAASCCLFLLLFSCSFLRLQPLAAQGAESSNDQFRQATEALKQGRLDDAAAGFATVVAAAPNFAEAYLNLGLVQEEQGKNDEAIATLQKAIRLKPRLRGANLFLGIAQYRVNQLDLATASLKKETTYDPSSASAWMWLGVVQLADGKADEAVVALDRARKLDPQNVDILYNRGRAHLLVSKNSYDEMYKADPDSWRVHQVLAQAYSESDRHPEAITEYLAALKKAPAQPGLHEELGSEYLATDKLEEAEAEFAEEVKLDPNNAIASFKLGATQIERGKAEQGKRSVEAALRKNPRLKNASYYLGRAEMQLGNNDAAINALKLTTASDSDPNIIEQAWYQLAILYRRLRQPEEAKKALAVFQRLKDESAARQQSLFEKKREAQPKQDATEEAAPPQ